MDRLAMYSCSILRQSDVSPNTHKITLYVNTKETMATTVLDLPPMAGSANLAIGEYFQGIFHMFYVDGGYDTDYSLFFARILSNCNRQSRILDMCACPTGYYTWYYTVNYYCGSCQDFCKTCHGIDYTRCNTCNPGFYWFAGWGDGNCFDICPTNYFGNNATWTCQGCPISCWTCTNNTICTSCKYILPNGNCGSTCGDNFYANSTKNCLSCDPQCLLCNGPTNADCLSCQPVYYAYYLPSGKASCFMTCPDGTYGVASTKKCLDCDFSCGTCTGPTKASMVS